MEDNKCSTKLESENLFTNLASKLSETRKFSGADPRQAPAVRPCGAHSSPQAARSGRKAATGAIFRAAANRGHSDPRSGHSDPSLTLAATSAVNPNPSFRARPRAPPLPARARKSGRRGEYPMTPYDTVQSLYPPALNKKNHRSTTGIISNYKAGCALASAGAQMAGW